MWVCGCACMCAFLRVCVLAYAQYNRTKLNINRTWDRSYISNEIDPISDRQVCKTNVLS